MILVSFFSEDNALSDEIKICYIFEYQSNKNWEFRFLGDTRYMLSCWTILSSMPLATGVPECLLDTPLLILDALISICFVHLCDGMKKNWTPQMCIFGHPILKSWLEPCCQAVCDIKVGKSLSVENQRDIKKGFDIFQTTVLYVPCIGRSNVAWFKWESRSVIKVFVGSIFQNSIPFC